MPDVLTAAVKPLPSMISSDIPALSDDECLRRLAQAVAEHDSEHLEHLDEVAGLIGRLAVTIE